MSSLPRRTRVVGVGDGEVAQEDGVDQGEDGGVGADAESEGEDGGGSEAGSLPQLSQRIAHVLHQGDDHRSLRSFGSLPFASRGRRAGWGRAFAPEEEVAR